MELKHIEFNTKFETKDENGTMIFGAYASTFGNVDSHDDVVMPGAFTESLKKRKPKIAYQHNTNDLAAVFLGAEEDETGLLIRGRFLNTPTGLKAYEEVKAGAIDQMSIGFSTKQSEFNENGIRLLKEIELYEVSFVTFPANEQAIVTSVKADRIQTIREFESFLRDAGYSRNEAKRIASKGFLTSEELQRDADNTELKNSIINLTNKIKGAAYV